MKIVPACLVLLAACASAGSGGGDDDDDDDAVDASLAPDGNGSDIDAAAPLSDGGAADAPIVIPGIDAGADAALIVPDAAAPPDADPGILTGGPCSSGSAGATAYRVRWSDGGGTAYVVYEVNGLPDPTDHTGAYGYVIGFTPSYVDTFLAEGGLLLNSSSFVDIELSTAGVTTIDSATLSIYGRSYNTTASGSFNWQTFVGTGASPTNSVANSAPYEWYSADMTTEIGPGDDGILLRIKAGPSSGALAVHRIELCMQAD